MLNLAVHIVTTGLEKVNYDTKCKLSIGEHESHKKVDRLSVRYRLLKTQFLLTHCMSLISICQSNATETQNANNADVQVTFSTYNRRAISHKPRKFEMKKLMREIVMF